MFFISRTIALFGLLFILLSGCTQSYCTNNNLNYCNIKETKELLQEVIDQDIQLITSARPPSGRLPNITGKLIEVNNYTIKLELKSEEETKIGVYQIKDIIGFVPITDHDEGGCDDKEPLVDSLKQLINRNVQLLTNDYPSTDSPIVGTLIDVTDKVVTLQLNEDENTIVNYRIDQIIGYVDKGEPIVSSKGQVTLEVRVLWPNTVTNEVDVTLIKEDEIIVSKTIDGVVRFITKPSGDIVIKGEDVPGYITPEKKIRLSGKNKFVSETLEYIASDIAVEGIIVDKTNLKLIIGEEEQLTASVLPKNANNQEVTWASDNESVATVIDGLVEAKTIGTATITATTVDGGKTASTLVTVVSIESVETISIDAIPNQVVKLPDTVSVILSDLTSKLMPVTWIGTVNNVFVVDENPEPEYVLVGNIIGIDLTTTITIDVDQSALPAIRVDGVTLNTYTESLYVGETLDLEAIVTPINATTKIVTWTSSNESVLTVDEFGLVTAMSPGSANITVTTIDGGFTKTAVVTVSSVPEVELIFATQEVFDTKEEVTIDVSNLASTLSQPTTYYVKVEQSGSSRLLGEGTVMIYPTSTTYNLYIATEFKTTTNYSNEYFVYMSTDKDYPKEDEMTLMTNFKVGTAVPTVPYENIHVMLNIIGGDLEDELNDITFILARELDDIEIADLTWQDYYDETAGKFIDEVKMIGHTDEFGVVVWEEPRETLKLGGYVLLEVTPVNYEDNLNLINPDSEDGSLLKEVHLTRNLEIYRYIINTYIG